MRSYKRWTFTLSYFIILPKGRFNGYNLLGSSWVHWYFSWNFILFCWYWGLNSWLYTCWTMPPALHPLETSHFLPRLAWPTVLLFYTSHDSWDDRCVSTCSAFFHWKGTILNALQYINSLSPSNNPIITSISHMRKIRHREVKLLAWKSYK
jgi:hypothetical protein